MTDEDLERLPLPAKHQIELSAFVRSDEVDPMYYEKSYYLEPEETGLKPYALLMKILEQKRVMGVATIAIRNKESLCALRPSDSSLVLETPSTRSAIAPTQFFPRTSRRKLLKPTSPTAKSSATSSASSAGSFQNFR